MDAGSPVVVSDTGGLYEIDDHVKIVKIYRIAIGIPLGTQIEYVDSATLGKALLERKALT